MTKAHVIQAPGGPTTVGKLEAGAGWGEKKASGGTGFQGVNLGSKPALQIVSPIFQPTLSLSLLGRTPAT